MRKSAFFIILGLLVFEKAKAQPRRDTLMYLMKSSGGLAKTKDSADYVMLIMPNDPKDKNSLYPVFEYYPNGKCKFTGTTHNQFHQLKLEGVCMSFFPSGHRESIKNYKDGVPVGDVIAYYPNGQLYTVERYNNNNKTFDGKLSLMECHDSTGKVLAENGNGHWLKFNEDFKTIYQEGQIKDGVEDGTWIIMLDATKKGEFVYTKGIITTPIDYSPIGIYSKPDIEPTFKGGIDQFYTFLGHTIFYPAEDRERNVQGKVFVSFIVEKDGTLTNIKIDKSPSESLAAEALRSVKLSPRWIPGSVGGVPVRTIYTVPINFTINHSN